MNALDVLAWLFTYVLHSTILIAGATLVTRVVNDESWRDVIWKAALLGAILTSSLTVGGGLRPFGGQWYAGDFVHFEEPARSVTTQSQIEPHVRVDPAMIGGAETVERLAAREPTPSRSEVSPLGLAIILGWLMTSFGLVVRLTILHVRFFRAVGDRAPVTHGPLPEMLVGLRREVGYWRPIRLSLCADCPTPIAIGTSEICLPTRYASDLDVEQQRGGLAHELAHLRRRDPIWQFVAAVVEAIFFFQPLNRVVRGRLRETAEHLSDDWAVSTIGSSAGLARCLSEIASWVGGVDVPRESLAMAEGGSPLLVRIRRLAEPRSRRRKNAWPELLGAASLVGLVVLLVPTVSGGTAPRSSDFPPLACSFTGVDTFRANTAGIRELRLRIPAGSVRVTGRAGASEARVVARRCASRSDLFDALHLDVRSTQEDTEEDLVIGFEQPSHLFSRTRGSIARIDIAAEVPAHLAVRSTSSMGEVDIADVGALRIDTSLGDVRVSNVAGDLDVVSRVGDVVVTGVAGSAVLTVGVGRISADRMVGDVTVTEEHTGPIEIRGAEANVTIGDGQAGDVHVDGVAGDLRVGRVAEGRLEAANVAGRIVTFEP